MTTMSRTQMRCGSFQQGKMISANSSAPMKSAVALHRYSKDSSALPPATVMPSGLLIRALPRSRPVDRRLPERRPSTEKMQVRVTSGTGKLRR